MIVIVDEGVDIHDLETLMWALSSRVNAADDIQIIPDVETYMRDPSTIGREAGEKGQPPYNSSLAIIDATIKADRMPLALPDEETMEAVRTKWSEFGLPPLKERPRLNRLLKFN